MKIKGLFLVTCLASIGLAQSVTVLEATHGKGRVESADSRVGEFDFEVARTRNAEGVEKVGGRSVFNQARNAHGRALRIEIRPGRIATNAGPPKTGEFGGRAVMTIPGENRSDPPRRIEGEAVVAVVDARNPDTTTDARDRYSIRFRSGNGNITFEFGGPVGRGDVKVRTRE